MKDGGPAFPEVTIRGGDNYNPAVRVYHRGMTLRDWFAGQALAGGATTAQRAYEMADAMLAERETQR